MDATEARPQSIWSQLKQDAVAGSSALRQLSRLVSEASVARSLGDPEIDSTFSYAGFFEVSAVDPESGKLLVTANELAEAVGLALLQERGEFSDISRDRFQEGPSYIELGGWIGSQQVAIQLMGLGASLGLWDLVTPALLGIEGQMAQELLGRGMLLIAPKAESPLSRWFDTRELEA